MEKREKNITTVCLSLAALIILTICLVKYVGKAELMVDAEVPDGYIAVFNGGAGEITYSTYVYKIDNGQANYGFKYVNTINTTESWGSPNWNIKVVKTGTVDWTDDVFKVAEEHGAYSYVIYNGQNYTIVHS